MKMMSESMLSLFMFDCLHCAKMESSFAQANNSVNQQLLSI